MGLKSIHILVERMLGHEKLDELKQAGKARHMSYKCGYQSRLSIESRDVVH